MIRLEKNCHAMSSSCSFKKPFVYNKTAFRSFQSIGFDDSWEKLGEYKPQKLKTFLAKTDDSRMHLEYDEGILEFTFQKDSQVSVYEGFIKYNSRKILAEDFIQTHAG